ncbi:MAG: hypothetical protein NVS1B14_11400 [Vulcanimicrobiaceae bacterium]
MAQKPTKRERKDDAKKRRLEEMRRRQRRARRRKMYTLGTVALALVAVLAGVMISRAANASARSAAAKLAKAGGCLTPKHFPSEGRAHIDAPQSVNYKTDPPTSGAHYNGPAKRGNGQPGPPELTAPTSTGVHKTQIPNEVQVHNLEHGHIAIQYQPNSIPPSLIAKLEALANADPTWVLVAPRQNAATKVAFTAWTIKQACDFPNDDIVKVAKDFIKRFKNKGPESVPGQPAPPQPTAAPQATATTSIPPKTLPRQPRQPRQPGPKPVGTPTKKK